MLDPVELLAVWAQSPGSLAAHFLLPGGKRTSPGKGSTRFTYIINLQHSEILSHPQMGTWRLLRPGHTEGCSLPCTFLAPPSLQAGAAGLWADPGPLRGALPLHQSWIPARPWLLPQSPHSLGLGPHNSTWQIAPSFKAQAFSVLMLANPADKSLSRLPNGRSPWGPPGGPHPSSIAHSPAPLTLS